MTEDSITNRRPAVAGTFYPGHHEALVKSVRSHLSSAPENQHFKCIKALIVPHAGYVYSGTVAAAAYNQLDTSHIYDNIFLIGSSHQYNFNGASVYTEGNFETPMGVVNVNRPLGAEIQDNNSVIFIKDPDVQNREHSLEVQLPFLQYLYKDKLRIVPIIIGTDSVSTIEKITQALLPYFNANNLFVISTDFSHYPDYENARFVDSLTANALRENSSSALLSVLEKNSRLGISNLATSLCGWTSVLMLLKITEENPATRYHHILYKNSGDTDAGDRDRVVGYHAMVVTNSITDDPIKEEKETEYLSADEKDVLLDLARVTIEEYLETGKISDAGDTTRISDKLKVPAGAFVTLKKNSRLRGCIGQFNPEKALYRVVQEMAVSAATRDYRFSGIKRDEMNEITIEISVLTPLRRITSIDEIVTGKHGIYIVKGNNSGTYLPQVASENSWNVEEFLGHCARDKAGIGWDGWKDSEIYIYEAYQFGER